MLGKNTGKDSGERRSNKGKPRRPPPVFIPLAIAPRPNEAIHTSPNPLPSDYPPSIPQRVGTDVSLVQLADAVEPSTASLVLRCNYYLLLAKNFVCLGELKVSYVGSSFGCCQTNIISFRVMYPIRQTRRKTMDLTHGI